MEKSTEKIKVSINQSGADLQTKYPDRIRANHQPVGSSFYKIDWDDDNKGKVLIDSGPRSFEISDVLLFTGSQNNDHKNEGMSQLNIYCGLTGRTGISHEDARKKFLAILSTLKNTGWKSTIPFSAPRLNGRDMLAYIFDSGRTITLPADYLPSLDEWMKLRDPTTWEFYADHTFLRINFLRDRNKMNTSKPGAYVINFTLTSELDYFRAFVDPSDREKWRELLPAELKDNAERRKRTEAELRLKGVHIDETYQDPPVPE